MRIYPHLSEADRPVLDELRCRCELVSVALVLCDASTGASELLTDDGAILSNAALPQLVATAIQAPSTIVNDPAGRFAMIALSLSADTTHFAVAIAPADRAKPLQLIEKCFADLLQARQNDLTIGQFATRLTDAYEQVQLLFRLARLLNHVENPHDIMHAIVRQIRQVTRFGWLSAVFDPNPLVIPDFRDKVFVDGQTPVDTTAFREMTGALLQTGQADDWTRILLPASDRLAAASGSEAVAEPISMNGRVIAALVAGSKDPSDPDIDSFDTQLLDATADFLGIFHQNIARFQEQRDLFLGTLHALTSAIDAKDRYTRGHSERVSQLARRMGERMGLEPKQLETLRIAGLVHDTGKIGVPESVLLKPGRLTEAEFAQLRRHPRIGYNMLSGIKPLADVLPGVLHHHERFDGKGYPDGLAGESIPFVARVLALADTYDAMTSKRSYRSALPKEKVLSEISTNAGTQFDPALAQVMLDMIEQDLSTGLLVLTPPSSGAPPIAA